MDETSTTEIEFTEITKSEWWVGLLEQGKNWYAGGAFTLFLGPKSCFDAAAAWFISSVCVSQAGDKPFFSKTMVVLPAGNRKLNYKERLIDKIRTNFAPDTRGKSADLQITTKFPHCFLEESECDNVLKEIEQLPDGSAVGICAAQLLRFAKLSSATQPETKTHTGFTVRQGTMEELTMPHLFELIRCVLALAGKKNLSIVLFVEEFTIDPGQMPEDLREHAELAILTTTDDPDAVAVYRAKLQAEQIRRKNGAKAAIEFTQSALKEPRHKAHALLLILGAEGRWFEAWNRIKPDLKALRDMQDSNILLNLATTASACGEADEALAILEQAIELGLDSIEKLNTAAFIAKKIKAWKALDSIIPSMLSAFPNHPYTFTKSFGWFLSNGQFDRAVEMARKNGDSFQEAWAILLGQPAPDWNTFLSVTKSVGREADGLSLAARYSLERGDLVKGKEFLSQISQAEDNVAIRAEILLEVVAKEIQFEHDLSKIQVNFTEVLRYIAVHPSDTDVRNRIAHIIKASEDVTRRTILIACCWDAFIRASQLFESSNAIVQMSLFGAKVDENILEETLKFIRAVASDERSCMFGKGVVPNSFDSGVSDDIMAGLGWMIQRTTEKPEFDLIKLELQSLNIACRARKEAAWDFQAAIQLLSAMVASGSSSDAFNVGETILSLWPDTIPELKSERLPHAWSCLADVYHRTRDHLIAILHLALCFESMNLQPAQQHICMLKQKLRLGSRIFRDFEFNQYARAFLSREHRLVEVFPERKREAKEILTTDISFQLREIDESIADETLSGIFQTSRELLEDNQETEWGMPSSIGVNLLNLCRIYGKKVPDGFKELVLKRVAKCPVRYQKLFHRFLLERPTVADIEGMMKDLVEDNVQDDQGYRFEMLNGILRRAIKTSCDKSDPELFLAAATWLSQPSLSASRATWQVSGDRPEAILAKATELFPVGSETNSERIRDYGMAMEHQIEKTESNFAKLMPLPLAASRYVAKNNEALCFLAYDSELQLCRLVVRRDRTEGPVRIGKEDWQHARFVEWLQNYPEQYSWDRFYEPFGERDAPAVDVIRSSLAQLQPWVPVDVPTVIILPEANMFGFSYYLNEQGGKWVGEKAQCCTAPSLPWLGTVRKLPQPKLTSIKAWLGHPTLADFAVQRPRGELTPILEKHGAQIVGGETPQPLRQADIGIVLSHGSRGLSKGFVGVNDVGKFTVDELVRWLGECKCVVLFVCNAGRSDRQISNNETFGLIGRLLQREVRTVIAPPAPMRIDLPGMWLDAFLIAIRRGETVAAAHAAAASAIRSQVSHPCAWGALQLFGDPSLSFQ